MKVKIDKFLTKRNFLFCLIFGVAVFLSGWLAGLRIYVLETELLINKNEIKYLNKEVVQKDKLLAKLKSDLGVVSSEINYFFGENRLQKCFWGIKEDAPFTSYTWSIQIAKLHDTYLVENCNSEAMTNAKRDRLKINCNLGCGHDVYAPVLNKKECTDELKSRRCTNNFEIIGDVEYADDTTDWKLPLENPFYSKIKKTPFVFSKKDGKATFLFYSSAPLNFFSEMMGDAFGKYILSFDYCESISEIEIIKIGEEFLDGINFVNLKTSGNPCWPL